MAKDKNQQEREEPVLGWSENVDLDFVFWKTPISEKIGNRHIVGVS